MNEIKNEIKFEVSVRTLQNTSVTFKLYNENFQKIDRIASECFKKSTMLIFNVSKEVHYITPYVKTIGTKKTRLWIGPFKDIEKRGLEVKPNQNSYTMGPVYSHNFHQYTREKITLN